MLIESGKLRARESRFCSPKKVFCLNGNPPLLTNSSCVWLKATTSHKRAFHFTTLSTSQVNFHPGITPEVLEIGALAYRINV